MSEKCKLSWCGAAATHSGFCTFYHEVAYRIAHDGVSRVAPDGKMRKPPHRARRNTDAETVERFIKSLPRRTT